MCSSDLAGMQGHVDIQTVDSLAKEHQAAIRGGLRVPDSTLLEQAYQDAWSAARGPLEANKLDLASVKDEIDNVIEGHGITTLAEYVDISRVGRVRALKEPERKVIWAVREKVVAALREKGCCLRMGLIADAAQIGRAHV